MPTRPSLRPIRNRFSNGLYTGPVDLFVLRRVLARFTIDADTLCWLGSHELERACRMAGP
jgi:hypothetical protein